MFPQVRETLGQLAAEAAMVEGMVIGMEAAGWHYGKYFVPNKKLLYSAMVLTQQLYPGNSSPRFASCPAAAWSCCPPRSPISPIPRSRTYIDQTQRSPVTDSIGRVKLFKLAWDAVGSEFGSRHQQYEMFYAGATMVTRGHAFRTYDWDRAVGLVDGLMSTYDLPLDEAESDLTCRTAVSTRVRCAPRWDTTRPGSPSLRPGRPKATPGVTVNSFTSVSLDPPLVLFCLADRSSLRPWFEGPEHFAVNVLAKGQQALSNLFARPS